MLSALGEDGAASTQPAGVVHTLAEAIDARDGSHWAETIEAELGAWLGARFDIGQAGWPQPDRDIPLFAAWRRTARLDRNLEIQGLEGFRAYVSALPRKPLDAIWMVLEQLGLPATARRAFLMRALASMGGWPGYLQRALRDGGDAAHAGDSLAAMLAIRMAYDGALARCFGAEALAQSMLAGFTSMAVAPEALGAREQQLAWQTALEHGYRRKLLAALEQGEQAAAERPRTGTQL